MKPIHKLFNETSVSYFQENERGIPIQIRRLINATLRALLNLGGSGSVDEIEDHVATILNLTDDQINEIHRGNRTKLSYRLAWARNYLKQYGLLENSSRGIWALTQEGLKTSSIDKEIVKRKIKILNEKKREGTKTPVKYSEVTP